MAEGRRREILEAALRVIAGGGPDAITHRRVAAEADVPLGSLTYYFESREDLVREAFRHYLAEASAFLTDLEREMMPTSVDALIEMVIEVTRREFTDPAMLRAEYELILYAARDEALSRDFNAWARSLDARLAEPLEAMGAARPMDAARTVIDLVRGFELERLARPAADENDLRRRLHAVVSAMTAGRAATSAEARVPGANHRHRPLRTKTKIRRTVR